MFIWFQCLNLSTFSYVIQKFFMRFCFGIYRKSTSNSPGMNINFSGNNFSEALFGKIWQLPPSQPGWYLLHSIPDKPSTWYYTKFFNLVLGTLMSLTSFFSKVIIERSKLDTKTSNGTWFDSYRYLHTRLIHFNPMLHFV